MFRMLLPASLTFFLIACGGGGGNTDSSDPDLGAVDALQNETQQSSDDAQITGEIGNTNSESLPSTPSAPVPSSPAPTGDIPGATSWVIEGNTIRFLNADYFQVQSQSFSNEVETVCDGDAACAVEDGRYQIVNQTSGEIWQYVLVGLDSVFWSQTKIDEAFVSWRHVVYNFSQPVRFDVYLNNQSVGSVGADIRDLRVTDFARGSRMNLAVFSVFVDGRQEVVGEVEVVTEGPSMDLVTFGRPSEDRNTFGFAIWDDLPLQSQQEFPTDCLFAIPTGGYCFSPSTRFLIGYSELSSEPSPEWEFPLPGENATNNIEALVHYHGSSARNFASREMALVADVTTEFADSRYEISVFVGTGTFEGTFPILEGIRFSSETGAVRQINLNGQDLRVEIGPERRRDEANLPAFALNLPRRLHIAGQYYEAIGDAATDDISGWTRKGAFFAEIDSQNGETLSLTFYPGLLQAEVPLQQ